MPQYTLKLVERFAPHYDLTVCEVNNFSDDFVVQRNKIAALVPLVQTRGDQKELVKLIREGGFDLLHFQEIPETFLDREILDQLYRPSRSYYIVVTTHSSYTDPSTIRYTADKYVLVSEWSRKVFEKHYQGSVPCEVWEYPVEKIEYDKTEAQQGLGWNPEYKHVLHVGLFTPGKNQKELIEIARQSQGEKICFHFVGNQAGNFQDYWEPLMKDFPSNCVWHGEQHETERYFKAANAFYFPSLFELHPIALKEAISYGLPIFIKKLHTYEDYYDGIATYLTDDISKNRELVYEVLGLNQKPLRIQALHLLTVTTHEREQKSIAFISQLQEHGIDYHQIINTPYDGEPPAAFCRRPDSIGTKSKYLGNGLGVLTGRHYGNFRAHVDAIRSIDTSKYDYTLIFEADANLECTPEEFIQVVHKACFLLKCENSPFVSLSNNPSGSKSQYNEDFWLTSPNQDLAHCYLVPSSEKQWYLDRIADSPWDGFDVWLNDVFIRHPRKRFTTTRSYSNQIEGLSLIDPVVKWSRHLTHYDYVEIGTSDFDTLVEIYPEGASGLSIEPIKTYLDRLPDKSGNTKVNAAITDQDCELTVYYVKPEDIEANQLPEWIKGCNSVGAPHPSVVRELTARGLMDIYTQETIDGLSFGSLISNCNIGAIDYLKIDTEGHDFVILRNLLQTSLRPRKIRFEANSLYTEAEIVSIIDTLQQHDYILVQRTFDDIVVRYRTEADSYVPDQQPVLIFSTGRRLQYFKTTLQTLIEKNPGITTQFKKVWIMDDRSSAEDRAVMTLLMNQHFGDRWNMICFNSNEPFEFVDKFRMIRQVITPEDTVLLLEDDWECHDPLNLPYHLFMLANSNWTQIAFCDPFEIQDPVIQNQTRAGISYWSNPYPNWFKHPVRWNGDICHWFGGVINNYTNNPSLIKGELFFRGEYIRHKNFEASFAGQVNGLQVFTQEALFRHFGEDSLINKL